MWVALLRGVNVGGGNRLPMADLRAAFTRLGWRDVQSYIASGNLVFAADGTAERLAKDLGVLLRTDFGLDVPVLVLAERDLIDARTACPFTPDDPRHVHIGFLYNDAAPDEALIASLKAPSEHLVIAGRVVYLFAPDGIGRSKLAEKLEKAVGAPLTARNLRTVDALAAMLQS